MKIYAIGDLHLGLNMDKPMNIFGETWENHVERLAAQWRAIVTPEDVVVLCGDLSWAMRFEHAQADLDFIVSLPGKKVCIKGNHDYWWEKIGVLNTLYDNMHFIQNTAYEIGDYVICGTRGWQSQDAPSPEDEKIYKREVERLRLSLKEGMKKGARQLIVALHYPPTYACKRTSPFTQLIDEYPVRHVVYGHLHDEKAWQEALQGEVNKVQYHLVASDYLSFCPKMIVADEN
ncbi:MAG: metallophosphoesterase [Niameybacter sp.]|uniref:metallophosphoesterase n=1 Tax=Niameybacter sp. TaxID=2033640 RepID=UPI002FC7C339